MLTLKKVTSKLMLAKNGDQQEIAHLNWATYNVPLLNLIEIDYKLVFSTSQGDAIFDNSRLATSVNICLSFANFTLCSWISHLSPGPLGIDIALARFKSSSLVTVDATDRLQSVTSPAASDYVLLRLLYRLLGDWRM